MRLKNENQKNNVKNEKSRAQKPSNFLNFWMAANFIFILKINEINLTSIQRTISQLLRSRFFYFIFHIEKFISIF